MQTSTTRDARARCGSWFVDERRRLLHPALHRPGAGSAAGRTARRDADRPAWLRLAAHLAGDTRTGILKSADRVGRLIDTFVLAQLRPLLKLATPSVTAHHLRDGNQTREIDLVLESASGQIVGIEIKAASTVYPRDAKHLAWLRDHVGTTFQRGIILHTGATTYPLGERIWAVPIAALWRAKPLMPPATSTTAPDDARGVRPGAARRAPPDRTAGVPRIAHLTQPAPSL